MIPMSATEAFANTYHFAPTGFAPAFFMRMLYNEVFAVMNSVL